LAAALHAVAAPAAAGVPSADFSQVLAWALRLQLAGMNSGKSVDIVHYLKPARPLTTRHALSRSWSVHADGFRRGTQ